MSGREFSPTKLLEKMQIHLLPIGMYQGEGAGMGEKMIEMDHDNTSIPGNVRGLSGLPHLPPFSFRSRRSGRVFQHNLLPL